MHLRYFPNLGRYYKQSIIGFILCCKPMWMWRMARLELLLVIYIVISLLHAKLQHLLLVRREVSIVCQKRIIHEFFAFTSNIRKNKHLHTLKGRLTFFKLYDTFLITLAQRALE